MLEDEATQLWWQGLDIWVVGGSDYCEGARNVAKALSRVPPGAP